MYLKVIFFKTITIVLSDMLNQKFNITKKEQIDGRTIRYICTKETSNIGDDFEESKNFLGNTSIHQRTYTIIKQKCNISENVYFFQFPQLYDGQGSTAYKTKIK